MTNSNSQLIQNKIIDGEQLYSDAINIILASANNQISIFDQDLSHGNFSSIQKFELFQNFLNKSPSSQLIIILQNTSYLLQKCPRLLNLLENYGHKMKVSVTNQSVKHAKDCFILADNNNYIKRIHIDQARFMYGIKDSNNSTSLSTRFKELQEEIQDYVSITKLGL